MSRYQRGHIYEAFGAFHVRFYQTEVRDGQLSRVQSVQVRSHPSLCRGSKALLGEVEARAVAVR